MAETIAYFFLSKIASTTITVLKSIVQVHYDIYVRILIKIKIVNFIILVNNHD